MKKSNGAASVFLSGVSFAGLLCGVALFSSTAHAADAATGPQIEQVIVTAEKRAENLESVPASITAISQEALDRNRISSIQDVTQLAPSVTWQQGLTASDSTVYIRGFGTNAFGVGIESSVAMVLDDVVLSRQNEAFGQLFNLTQMQILRGPQGTLFGTDASAGAMIMTTAAPTKDFEGKADLYYGSYNELVARGTVSGPLSANGSVAGRLTGFYRRVDGNIKNKFNGQMLNGVPDSYGFRGKVSADITSRLSMLVTADYSEMHSNCCAETIRYLPANTNVFGIGALNVNAAVAGITPGPYNLVTSLDAPSFDNTKSWGVSAVFNYDLDWANLKSITAFRRWQETNNSDIDFSPLAVFLSNGGLKTQSTFTQELRLTSEGDGPLKWVAGMFYSNNRNRQDFIRWYGGTSYQNLFSRLLRSEFSMYGQADYRFDTGTHVILGGRWQTNSLRYSAIVSRTHFSTFANPNIPTSFSHNHALFKAGLKQEFGKTLMAYFTFSQGYKGQAVDLTTGLNATKAALQPIAPETVNSYEVGFKGNFFNRRLTVNADLFREEFSNYQAQAYDQTALTFRILNAGKVRSQGFELQTDFAATDNLTLTANATVLDTKIIQIVNTGCHAGQTVAEGCVGRQQNLAGARLPNAPKTKLYVGANYMKPIMGGKYVGFANLNYSWQSSVQFALDQDPFTVQDAYGVANLSFGAEAPDSGLRLTVFVNNLFDQHYASFIREVGGIWGGSTGTTQQIPRQAERTFGVRLGVTF